MARIANEQIAALVDAAFDEEVAFLRELVRVPTDTPPGDNARHAERAAELLGAMGFTVERFPVDAEAVRAAGLTSLTNLIVRRRFGDGPVIALNAHGDVVPPGDGWTKPPYDGLVENGRMYGRGVAVSKSDFATYTFALRALEKLDCPLAGTRGIALHLRRGVRRPAGPQLPAAHRRQQARPRHRRRLLLRHRDGAQRLPAAGGDGAGQVCARRHARDGRRCAGCRCRDPQCAL